MNPSRLILLSYCEDVQAGPLLPSPPLDEESLGFEGLVMLLFLGSSTRTLSLCLELVGEVSGWRGAQGDRHILGNLLREWRPDSERPGNVGLEQSLPALGANRLPRMSFHWFPAAPQRPALGKVEEHQ